MIIRLRRQQVKATDKQFFIAEDLPRKVDEANVKKEKKMEI